MIKSKELNVGIIGEHLTIVDLLMNGYQAFGSAQGMEYDIVADIGGRLLKLQVKTTTKMRLLNKRSRPIYFFHIKRTGKNGSKFYKKGDFDGYALVALDKRTVFYATFDECKSNSLCIRDKELNYDGKKGGGIPSGFYYQDMTLDNFIKKICQK